MIQLGQWAAGAVAVSVALYLAARFGAPGTAVDTYRNFFLLSAGAATGTWLSFSLRRVILSFQDLAVLEEDRLRPALRIAFMIVLTVVIGLLFWTSAVQFGLGGFKSDLTNGPSALLVGALCGIAERAIASAVSKRADDFAAGVGGKPRV